MRDVAIIGVGLTNCGELWESSLRDLYVEAAWPCAPASWKSPAG